MINKKYRQYLLWIVLLSISIIGIVMGCLPIFQDLERLLSLIGGIIVFISWLMIIPLYFEFKDDRIVVFQGVMSENKELKSSYKKREFLLEDIKDIYVNDKKEYVYILLKNGNKVMFSIMCCMRKNEVVDLVSNVRLSLNTDTDKVAQ